MKRWVKRVALQTQRAGRLVWRLLSPHAPSAGEDGSTRWLVAMPDLFSICHRGGGRLG